MSRLAALLAVLIVAAPAALRADTLVSTLSDNVIEITSQFVGSRIVVFGAVREIDPGEADASDYQVAVVVEGPSTAVVTRRRERVLGVWTNTDSRRFFAVPSYYVVHLSENLDPGRSQELLSRFRLGLESLDFVHNALARGDGPFAESVIEDKRRRGLYEERENAVQFLAPDVFRTTFFLPSEIPLGNYRVSVHLFRDGAFMASRVQNLLVLKTGFSDRLARFADEWALPYGLLTVALGLFTGWFAGFIFRRP
ncbi:MAG TPA: TIGR02186 family protein [Afifellaceae bacterium]|nr:TIGR02186 family protein [Afifellaceae bacterium]